MEICSIASGSSGNCICAGTQNCHLMIDAGISGKRIEAGLNSVGLKTAEMEGILITHEHSDHISGLGVIARRYGLPIIFHRYTRNSVCLYRTQVYQFLRLTGVEPRALILNLINRLHTLYAQ